jgi:hypothetical protein
MICLRELRSTLGVVGTIAIVGCFAEAGDVGSADTSEGTGAASSTTGSGSTSGVAVTTGTDGEVTGATSSSSDSDPSSTADSSSSAADSSSTGEVPLECECPPAAVVCEGFEAAGLPDGWTTPTDIQPDPTVSADAALCGDQGLAAAVGANDVYSVLITEPAFGDVAPGPVTLSMRLRMTAECLAIPTRVLAVSLLEGVTSHYEVRLSLGGDEGVGVQIVVGGNPGPLFVAPDFAAVTPDAWHQVRLDFDGLVGARQPMIGVAVDGDAAVVDAAAVPGLPAEAYEEVRLALGPYRFEVPFEAACEIHYDDVWLFPTP